LIFDTFTWKEGEKDDKIKDVLTKFHGCCEPRFLCSHQLSEKAGKKNKTSFISSFIVQFNTQVCSLKHLSALSNPETASFELTSFLTRPIINEINWNLMGWENSNRPTFPFFNSVIRRMVLITICI